MEDMVGIADGEEGEMEGVEYTDLERRLSVVVREGEGGIGSRDDGGCVPTLWQSGHRRHRGCAIAVVSPGNGENQCVRLGRLESF